MKNVCHIYTLEYDSVVKEKKNDILNFASKWMEIKLTLLSEITQAQKTNMVCSHSLVDSSHKQRTLSLSFTSPESQITR